MKKLIISLFTLILFLHGSTAFASNIEVLPTMQSKTTVQDRVWVATFQLVWNDFMDRILHNPVKFAQGTPQIANELNMQEFTSYDIYNESFYKYCGKVTKSTKKTITKAIKRKFKEQSDILDSLDLTPNKNAFLIYAMLKKDFQFARPFDKLGKSKFRNQQAEFFGINNQSDNRLKDGVRVLFYNSPYDYAVVLDTKTKDEVYLYKTSNTKPFNSIYADMLKKQSLYKGEKKMADRDELKVPNLKFFEEKEFSELTGKRIKGSNFIIEKAIETVKFEMDNEGVELKSEAAMSVKMTCLKPENTPRYFYFNDTFVLFLQEKGKPKPYFALRVYDINKFQ